MSGPSRADQETARLVSEVARRAIRRLDILEWVIFGGACVIAITGGAGVAWLVVQSNELDFRPTWIVTSLLLFVIPGTVAITQMRRAERASALDDGHREEDDG
jgi:uncharacterized membrane protein